MPCPFLTARVEKRNSAICYRIVRVRLGAFEAIARTTGKPEILFFISAAASCGPNVLDFQIPTEATAAD